MTHIKSHLRMMGNKGRMKTDKPSPLVGEGGGVSRRKGQV